MYAQHVERTGCKLFEAICRMDLESIVAKREDGLCSRDARWIKVKNPNYTQPRAGANCSRPAVRGDRGQGRRSPHSAE
jgi:ATP-dependent DNA ligase